MTLIGSLFASAFRITFSDSRVGENQISSGKYGLVDFLSSFLKLEIGGSGESGETRVN
jgi:hypothetical protein